MTPLSDAARLQQEIAEQVVELDGQLQVSKICAADVAYDGQSAYCSAVVVSRSGEMLEYADLASAIEHPYVPGFLMLREAPPIFATLSKLESNYDLLLVDGHGRLHPRRAGIACYLGVKLGKPCIGVAKSLLCGTARSDGSIELDGLVLGHAIGSGKNSLYVSVGYRVSLSTAVSLVRELGKGGTPEALRLADSRSKMQKRKGVRP